MDDITFNQASSIKENIMLVKQTKSELDRMVEYNDRIQEVKLNFMNDTIHVNDPDEELVDMIREWCDKKIERLNEQFKSL